MCTFCAPVCSVLGRLRTCQRSGTSGGVRPPAPNAEVQLYVVVYWKKEEQEETAMANAIYEKLQGSVIRRRTGWG